jgi:malate dehydrogenase (oxaloacetate-decarboxylating)
MTDFPEQDPLYVPYAGSSLLETPLLNKSSAFTAAERASFNLTGLLPPRYETIEEQVERVYLQYSGFTQAIHKHVFLRAIQDGNETLYFRLIQAHIDEMLPIIYTPTVGDACEQFSDIYRSSRGLFIAYSERDQIDDVLHNAAKRHVKIIVVTDGERILGLGDQGIGGMGIPIGKLALYTACGGISPAYTLPVMLDVGTNNQELLDNPHYMGLRHKRIGQAEYDEFVELFIRSAQKRWPGVMIQFEDFAQQNATPLLNRYRHQLCCFNDDIQGTAAVTVGTVLAACRGKGEKLREQRIVFVGAGSAGCGIAEHMIMQMCTEGSSDAEARRRIYMVDRDGLLTDGMPGLRDFQQKLVQGKEELANWSCAGEYPSLPEVISNAKPGVLIGVSGQAGLFTEEVVRGMKEHCELPIIFPLSNPSKQVEARPEQVLEWTDGEVIIATGSPFGTVSYQGRDHPIAQCNNAYIFPGIGLGVVAAGATRVSDGMLMATSAALAEASPLASSGGGALLPPIADIAQLSRVIAFEVGKVAQQEGLAPESTEEELRLSIERNFWKAEYRAYKRVSM